MSIFKILIWINLLLKHHLTYSINIRKALEFFFRLGIVEKEIKEHRKKDYIYYNITELGELIIKKL